MGENWCVRTRPDARERARHCSVPVMIFLLLFFFWKQRARRGGNPRHGGGPALLSRNVVSRKNGKFQSKKLCLDVSSKPDGMNTICSKISLRNKITQISLRCQKYRKNLRANVEPKDMLLRPKMKVRRSLRRGAEPLKEYLVDLTESNIFIKRSMKFSKIS